MSRIQRIDSICTSDTKKLFNIYVDNENLTYVADIEEQLNKNLDKNNTFGKGNISTDIGIINNIYLINNFFIKSAEKVGNNTSTYSYANIFLHNITKFLLTVQVDNVIYGITDYNIFGHYFLHEDIYSYISSDTGRILPSDTYISTLIFNKSEIKNKNFENAISANIENILYNKIVEFPGNEFNDYDSGNYTGNVYNTKNHYSAKYNMEHTNENILENARKYVGIGNFNLTLYLKYYDNINYYNDDSNNICSFNNTDKQLKYLHIEVIGALNRSVSNTSHKTSLYSLNINTDINNKIQNQSILKLILKQIANNVNAYLEKLTPVNTQIFKINVN